MKKSYFKATFIAVVIAFASAAMAATRYIPVEYLEGNANVWADTGAHLTYGQRFVIRWSQKPEITYVNGLCTGAWTTGTNSTLYLSGSGYKQANNYPLSLWCGTYRTFTTGYNAANFVLGNEYEDVLEVRENIAYSMRDVVTGDQSAITAVATPNGTAYDSGNGIQLFRTQATESYMSYKRVHGASLSYLSTGSAVFNLIPVIREVDGDNDTVIQTPLFYDTVRELVVTSMTKTAFVAGPAKTDTVRWNVNNLEFLTEVSVDGEGAFTVDSGTAIDSYSHWYGHKTVFQLTAVPPAGMVFRGWGGEIGANGRNSQTITLTADRARKLVARFAPSGNECDYWVHSITGAIDHVATSMRLKTTIGGGTLSVNGPLDLNGQTLIDLDQPVYNYDWSTNLAISAIGSSAFQNKTTIEHVKLPDTLLTLNSSCFQGCTALQYVRLSRNLKTIAGSVFQDASSRPFFYPEPFLPPTVTSIGVMTFKMCWTTNEILRLSNPSLTAWTGEMLGRMLCKVIDMRGCGITTCGTTACYGNSVLQDIYFPEGFASITASGNFLGNCSNVRHLYFTGGPVSFAAYNCLNYLSASSACWCPPKWNKAWEAALADPDTCQVVPMTAKACENFAANHPGEPMPVKSMKFCTPAAGTYVGGSNPMGVQWWYPDDPPTYETVNYFDILKWENRAAQVTPSAAETLFDGTVYSASTKLTQYLWTGDGSSVIYELPEIATNTRALKFTGYRLHQASLGDWRNARAPVRWRLEGKRIASDVWETLDEVELTGASAEKWGYMTDDVSYTVAKAGVAPDCDHSALTFSVPSAKQDCYKAFRFTPLASYNTVNSVADATPYSLMEIEFLGFVTTAEPVAGDFEVDAPRWNSIDFSGTVTGFGDDAAKGLHASSAVGWVEVSEDSTFATGVFKSPVLNCLIDTAQTYSVPGLAGNTSYNARFVISNNLDAVSYTELDGECSTLSVPFVAGQPVASTNDTGKLTVDFSLVGLYASSATVELYYRASPTADWQKITEKNVSSSGNVDFGSQNITPGATSSVKVVVSADGITDNYEASTFECWIVDLGALKVTNSKDFSSFAITVNGASQVALSSIISLGDVTDFDFTLAFIGTDGGNYTFVSPGAVFNGNTQVKKVLFPETVTEIPANAFKEAAALAEVKLSSVLTKVGSYAFYNCKSLAEISPLLPNTCTNIGEHAFASCEKIRELELSDEIRSLPSSTFHTCSSLGRVKLPAYLETISDWEFAYCYALTNVTPKFLPDTLRNVPDQAFVKCPVQGEHLYLENTNITYIGSSAFDSVRIKYVDLSKTRIRNYGAAITYAHNLKQIVFPSTMTNFNGQAFSGLNGSNQGVEVVFNGNIPSTTLTGSNKLFYNSAAKFYFRAKRGNASWAQYIAENSTGDDPLVRPLTPAERTTFLQRFPGMRMPECMLSLKPAENCGFVYFRYLPSGTMLIMK